RRRLHPASAFIPGNKSASGGRAGGGLSVLSSSGSRREASGASQSSSWRPDLLPPARGRQRPARGSERPARGSERPDPLLADLPPLDQGFPRSRRGVSTGGASSGRSGDAAGRSGDATEAAVGMLWGDIGGGICSRVGLRKKEGHVGEQGGRRHYPALSCRSSAHPRAVPRRRRSSVGQSPLHGCRGRLQANPVRRPFVALPSSGLVLCAPDVWISDGVDCSISVNFCKVLGLQLMVHEV
ncbi:unnamed protein product, partial [Urochloa humidicola]